MGIVLSNIAIEEITSIAKYLKYINILAISSIILLSIYPFNKIYAILITLTTIIILSIIKEKNYAKWTYASLGALIYVSTLNESKLYSLYIAIIIFIYGMSIATIDANKHFKNKINGQIKRSENKLLIKKIFSKYALYPIIGMTFYIVFTYVF
ncbi:MAG: hypothetical protein ACP5N1_05350 [Candidatus Woesearchaeota archaeon]